MISERTKTIILWTTLVAALASVWWWLLPPELGGRTTLFTTHGISMEPMIHDGDLAVLHKRRSGYQVGDVIAYHAKTLNTVSLHRIISVEGNSYTTKGDNNAWTDLDHPTNKLVIGKLDHVYGGMGRYLPWLKSVPVRIGAAGLCGILVFFALKPTGEKIRKKELPKLRNPKSFKPSRALKLLANQVTIGALAASLACFMGVTVLGFSHPIRVSHQQYVVYNLGGHFGYSAQVTPNADVVYRDSQLSTGDPIYLSLVNELFLTFNLDLDSTSHFKGEGDITTIAILSGKSGWSHEIPLGNPVPINNNTGRFSTVINIADMKALSQRIQQLTKVPDGGYTLTIRPTVHLDGTLAGQPLKDTFVSELSFNADDRMWKIASGSATPLAQNAATTTPTTTPSKSPDASQKSDGVGTGLNTTKGGQVNIPPGAESRLSAFGVAAAISMVRMTGIVGTLISGAALAIAIYIRRRGNSPDDDRSPIDGVDDEVLSELIVSVSNIGGLTDESPIVDVSSLSELVKLARKHDSLVLHQITDNGDVFVVNLRDTSFRYTRQVPSAASRFGSSTITEHMS